MKIAIASGKGGTGKTLISTNFAEFLSRSGNKVDYLDCDVEEPNGHLFFNTTFGSMTDVTIPVPLVDHDACDLCGKCTELCEFGAIIKVGQKLLTFPELCHGCGGCSLICPLHAITEVPRKIGEITQFTIPANPGLRMVHGLLNIGEALAVPVIADVRAQSSDADFTIIDSPPGTSCPVIEAVKETDFVLLVTEPTPFGLNDLKLAVEMVRTLQLPFGVAINQLGIGDNQVQEYCELESIPILLGIPYSRKIAELYSHGSKFLNELPEFNEKFQELFIAIQELVH